MMSEAGRPRINLPIPLSSRPTLRHDEHGSASLESYPLEEIQTNLRSSDQMSRRSSNASLMSATSSQAAKTSRTSIQRVFKSISIFTRELNIRLTDRIRRSRYHGWRMGVLVGCCMSAFVLGCNVTIAVVGSQINSGYQGGISDLIIGPATTVSRSSTAAHLLINVFSTILLGASNYTMQVLSSPTRKDLDIAHSTGKWLDVGILSIRNLWNIPRGRAALWFLLAASSIPLHLFYNAAVFQIATYNNYNVLCVDLTSEYYIQLMNNTDGKDSRAITHRQLANNAWQQIYGTQYVSEHGDLYLILDKFAFNSSQKSTNLSISDYYPMSMPGGQENLQNINKVGEGGWINYDALATLSNSTAYDYPTWPPLAHVTHGIAKIVTPESRLQISLTFMLVVIFFNSLKLAVMGWILFTDKSAYIVTLGDAAASFLERPDPTTRHQCTLGKEEMLFTRDRMPCVAPGNSEELDTLSLPSQGMWRPGRRECFLVLGRDRQIFFALLLCVTLSANVLVPLLGGAEYAWGTSSSVLVNEGAGTLTNAWIVNTPQLGLSSCYLALNSIATSLAGASEWNNMARYRKGLRVTDPRGKQRSTYFLQLPYKWAAPLIIVSGTLHWLLSQSFFLVRLNILDREGRIESSSSKSACGYSQLSLVVFWGIALLLLSSIAVAGNRGMQQKMPVAASCSLVISAACHPPSNDIDAHLGAIRWGVVEQQSVEGYDHCCLTTLRGTKKPTMGRKYF